MTASRHIVPGSTYLLTRRCHERRYFMAPTNAELVNAMYYILAEAAQKHAIDLHVGTILSNHHHTEFTDPNGVAPRFVARLHRHLARAINCSRGRWDGFWEAKQSSLVRLCDAEAVMDKAAYVVANPVRAGLVLQARHWPGVILLPRDILGPGRVFERPTFFFRDEEDGGRMPAKVCLRPVKPPQFAHLSNEDFVAKLEANIRSRCREHRKQIRQDGRTFMKVKAVRKQKWHEKPQTPAPRRQRHPHISAKCAQVRREAIHERADFLSEYGEALTLFRRRPVRKGSVVFPRGTWQMRVRHHVRCRPPPPDTS